MVKGFDASHNNDPINWSIVDPAVQFVILKATQGSGFKDPVFNSYWQHLKTTNLKRGAYHFLTASSTAQEQADNFLSLGINFTNSGCLPPFLDVEDQVPASLNSQITNNKPAFIQLITDWLNIIEEATGRKPIIYSYKNFFAEYLNNHSWPDNGLWLASYQSQLPGLPKGYTKLDFWQYSERGQINGLATGGEWDLDYYTGTPEQLNQLANITT